MIQTRLISLTLLVLLAWGCGQTSPENFTDKPSAINDGDAGQEEPSARRPKRADGEADADGVTQEEELTQTDPYCGNGLIEPGESCDGNCPTVCDDGNTCTTDSMIGSPETCDAVCVSDEILTCADDDGCCPANCEFADDNDCSQFCGDDVVDPGESCDGDCLTTCDDGDACTRDTQTGLAAACNVQCGTLEITNCVGGDGCCAPGCTSETDDDCEGFCGNGIVEEGEFCDGDCPTACADGDACTTDVLVGDAADCTASCVSTDVTSCIDGDGCCPSGCTSGNDDDCSPSCGNGVVDSGETCDGDCPTAAACDDGDACTIDSVSGSAGSCSAQCSNATISACVDSDGCCPSGCNASNDDDCGAVCGNGVVEAGETCDGDCPTSCNDGNACTTDRLTGSASSCSAACTSAPVVACTDGDGCCPAGCSSANDDDCGSACGNGIVEPGETCDGNCPSFADCSDGDACTTDTVVGSGNACTAQCASAPVTACTNGDGCCPSGCSASNDDDCQVAVLDCTDDSTWPAAWKTLEAEILAETNRRRTAAGGQTCGTTHYPAAQALNFNPQLREAARCHALDMITNNFFAHQGSDGSRVGARVDRTGYYWHYVGENLAAGNETAPKIVDQWMNSPTHCKNVMKAVYEDLGVGYAYSTNTTYNEYSAQAFGTEF